MNEAIYALIGKKLGHSYSVKIHKELGNKAYRLIELNEDELDNFFAEKNIAGLNITIPYKQDVMKYCDVISDEAKKIGSINTIVRKDGKLFGFNTDKFGFEYMVNRKGISVRDKKVIILGKGGTYLTAKSALEDMGAREIVCVCRGGKNNFENISDNYDAEIIVNATPVGMYPNNLTSIIDLEKFKACQGVIDVVYNPGKTHLILEAQRLNIPFASGLAMLVAQAVKAEEIFFDIEAEKEKTEEIIKNIEAETNNIVLIGMPGCGKTSVGKEISKMTGRECLDTDEMIEERTGIKISEIFERYGEKYFRELETEALKQAGMQSGKVIMTGGGIIKNKRNYYPMAQNSKIYFIKRDIELLAMNDRPLSTNRGRLAEMYKERLPMYMEFCDKMVENNTTIKETAKNIWSDFSENTCN